MPTSAGRRVAAVAVLLLAAGSLVLALALADRPQADSHRGMRSMELGLPLTWVQQDQSSLDPPGYPWTGQLLSPWEHPVSVSWTALAVDIAVMAASLALVAVPLLRGVRILRGISWTRRHSRASPR